MKIEVHQQDWIPGFAAFIDDGSIKADAKANVAFNIGAFMAAVETKDVEPKDIPYAIAETIMHEVMHALEAWAGVEFSEERIEELLLKYRLAHQFEDSQQDNGAGRHSAKAVHCKEV